MKNKILFLKNTLKKSDIWLLKSLIRNHIVDKEINWIREVLKHLKEIKLSVFDIEYLGIDIINKKNQML